MVKFLSGEDLKGAINAILLERGCRCAVAFWGHGSEKRLFDRGRGDFKIVCNLSMGGTNPYAIEKLNTKNVRHNSTLHAKVYIGSGDVVVASANASVNGLGMEGNEQASWIEAGVSGIDSAAVVKWFDSLWDKSKPVTPKDLAAAKLAWKHRQQTRLLVPSLGDYQLEASSLPLLYWTGDSDWTVNEVEVRRQLGDFSDRIRQRIDDSLEVESGDEEAMKDGTWLLVWKAKKDGLPARTPRPYWFHAGQLVFKSFRYDRQKKWRNSVLETDRPPTEPFDLREPFVIDAILEVLSRSEFEDIRDLKYKAPFFTNERLKVSERFWPALKLRFAELSGLPHGSESAS